MPPADETMAQQVDAVRAFNRDYTRRIGVLDEYLLASPYTLTQARVLFELGTRQVLTAQRLGDLLRLDAGYLSRIVHAFEADGLLRRRPSAHDARARQLELTESGRAAFNALDAASRAAVAAQLCTLPAPRRAQAVALMDALRRLWEPARGTCTLRPWASGDLGWAIERHGELYAAEYGWDRSFEALVAQLFGAFAAEAGRDARRQCWIAELDGARAGCAFVVPRAEDTRLAQLRCLLVEPFARGHGVGRCLVEQAVGFARQAGYRGIMLWTNDVLAAARRLYQRAGFRLLSEQAHHSFGQSLVGQEWLLEFTPDATGP